MLVFRLNTLIAGMLMLWPMVTAGAQIPILDETFSSATPLDKWAVKHFRGDASLTMAPISENGNTYAKLAIHGQGNIVDAFYTPLTSLTNNQKKLEITFRYKASKAFLVYIAISRDPGCMTPCMREEKTLEADGKWHNASVLFDLKWVQESDAKQQSSRVLEFLVDNLNWNNAKDGDFILIDDVRIVPIVRPAVPTVRWCSPSSMLIIDKTPSQGVLLDLMAPEGKSCSFDVEVVSAATGKVVYQHSERVTADQRLRIDAEKYPVGSYAISATSGGAKLGQWTFKKYPYRENAVFIHDGVPYLNGEPFLILGLYHSSDAIIKIVNGKTFKKHPSEAMLDMPDLSEEKPDRGKDAWTRDKMFKGMSERGFNTAFYSWGVAPESFFKEAGQYRLKVVCESANLLSQVDKVKNQPNILGWYGLDEARQGMAAHCADIYKQYKEIDPYHPVMAAFSFGGVGYGDHRMVDFVMPDPYPFKSADVDFGPKVRYHMESDREGLLRGDPTTCIIYIPQLFTTDDWAGYSPTIEQVRAEVYTAIHYGAKGFFYYALYTSEPYSKGMPLNPKRKYWFLPESPLWNEIGSLNRELMAMKDVILLSKVDPTITVKTAGSVLGHGVVLPDKKQYVLVVNTGPKPQNEIKISGLKSSQKMVAQYNSPTVKVVSDGEWTVDLKGYGVGIYLINEGETVKKTAVQAFGSLRDRSWTWGYVIDKIPGDVPFVDGKSTCSLETGAKLLGTPNVVYMNSNHDQATLTSQYLDRLASSSRIICGLQHGDYAGAAKKVSALSQKYPNIVGGLIDDFMDFHGPSKDITPEQTKAVYDALKSVNPALKLYAVRYTWQDQKDLIPYLPYIDAINLWVWVGEEKPWRETLEPEIDHIRAITHKPILLGLFMHDYGGTKNAIAMNVLELQTRKAVEMTKAGKIEGFVILQSGWFHDKSHQTQVQWLKKYLAGEFAADSVKP